MHHLSKLVSQSVRKTEFREVISQPLSNHRTIMHKTYLFERYGNNFDLDSTPTNLFTAELALELLWKFLHDQN